MFTEQVQKLQGSPPMEVTGVGKNGKHPGLGPYPVRGLPEDLDTVLTATTARTEAEPLDRASLEGLSSSFLGPWLWCLRLQVSGCCQGAAGGTGSDWGLAPVTALRPVERAAHRAWVSRLPAQRRASPSLV